MFAADAVGGVTICVWPDPQWAQNWILDIHVENSVLSKPKTDLECRMLLLYNICEEKGDGDAGAIRASGHLAPGGTGARSGLSARSEMAVVC